MRSATNEPRIITNPKPVKPAPVMLPRSDWVKPNSLAQSTRMLPRTPKPTPEAKIAKKPAHKSRFALGTVPLSMLIHSLSFPAKGGFAIGPGNQPIKVSE